MIEFTETLTDSDARTRSLRNDRHYWQTRAEKAEQERDEARRHECSDLDAHWRLGEALASLKEANATVASLRAEQPRALTADDMTAESSTHTYESGVQETVTLRRGPATPHDCALLKITYSDGEIADCYVSTAWLRDRADQLADTPRPLTHDDIEQLVTQNRYRVADAIRALYPEEAMATDVLAHTVITALTEPTRPEGAEEIEAVIRKVVPSHPEDRYGDLADRLAERGVRVTGGN